MNSLKLLYIFTTHTHTTLVYTFNIFYAWISTASNDFVEYAMINWKMILIIYPLFKSWLERQNEVLYREWKRKRWTDEFATDNY